MSTALIILIAAIAIIIIVILFIVILLPGMALFNKISDEKYNADEKDLLTGTLTTGIASVTSTGEVVTTFVTESRKTMPARIFTPNKDGVTELSKGAAVLIVETKDGIAYVIPYQEMIF